MCIGNYYVKLIGDFQDDEDVSETLFIYRGKVSLVKGKLMFKPTHRIWLDYTPELEVDPRNNYKLWLKTAIIEGMETELEVPEFVEPVSLPAFEI